MKHFLSTILAASFFMACNAGKEKTATENNKATDSAKTNAVVSTDSNQQTISLVDTTPVSASRLIVPGKSIGLTSLGQKNSEATKHLGPAAKGEAAMGGKSLLTWYSKPVVHGTDTVINETEIYFTTRMEEENESRVRHIRITSSFFATAQHIRTGSTQDSIQKYFPGIKKIASYTSPKTKKQVLIYDDVKGGIAFEIENGICIGILVHQPDDLAYETYNSLFDVQYY